MTDSTAVAEPIHHANRLGAVSCHETYAPRVTETASEVTCEDCKTVDYARLVSAAEADAYEEDAERAAATPAAGSTRRIIMHGSTTMEIERSHVDGKAARLTVGMGSSGRDGVLVHMSDAELARLVSAGLRLLAGSDAALEALAASAMWR